MSRPERRAMVRRDVPGLSLSRQCEVLSVSRLDRLFAALPVRVPPAAFAAPDGMTVDEGQLALHARIVKLSQDEGIPYREAGLRCASDGEAA